MKNIVLLSKDATLPEYFGPYNSPYTKTPNIDELAAKGTVFKKHYTAAPSTSMAFAAMFTGKYSYEMGYSHYIRVPKYQGVTLFDILHEQGYECHLMWSKNYIDKVEGYTNCYGEHTVHHDKFKFNQACGFNAKRSKQFRKADEPTAINALQTIIKEIDTIDYKNKDIFLWIHMPHCIVGRRSYGDDIDIFDQLVGEIRKRFGDDNLFVTADHGHMNGAKNKAGYGFDVYEMAAHIPLITPLINNLHEVDFPTSNTQLSEIILNRTVSRSEYVLCDCAYYAQPSRKIAIIKDNYYYIYNKFTKKEELYDMIFDPNQNVNLLDNCYWFDWDRLCQTDIRQVTLYPYWDNIEEVRERFREIKNNIWINGNFIEEGKQFLKHVCNLVIGLFIGIKRLFN